MEISGDLLRKKIENGENVIIDFWANFCGPCRVMKPKFEKVAESNQDKNLEFDHFNTPEAKRWSIKYFSYINFNFESFEADSVFTGLQSSNFSNFSKNRKISIYLNNFELYYQRYRFILLI